MFEVLLERSAEKDLRRLSAEAHGRVVAAIAAPADDPRPAGAEKLSGRRSDWRVRVGDYRVLYEIAESVRIIGVYRVRHRRDVYRDREVGCSAGDDSKTRDVADMECRDYRSLE